MALVNVSWTIPLIHTVRIANIFEMKNLASYFVIFVLFIVRWCSCFTFSLLLRSVNKYDLRLSAVKDVLVEEVMKQKTSRKKKQERGNIFFIDLINIFFSFIELFS
jgi:hypothetical protein